MYAGYQEELRNMMRNPTGLLAPRWSSTAALGVASILFWFGGVGGFDCGYARRRQQSEQPGCN